MKNETFSRSEKRGVPRFEGERILLVTADTNLQLASEKAFPTLGARLVSTRNGWEACVENHRGEYDGIVLDNHIKVMDQHTVLKAIRKHDEHVFVVAVGDKNDPRKNTALLKAGADSVLVKPFELRELFDLLREVDYAQRAEGRYNTAEARAVHTLRNRVRAQRFFVALRQYRLGRKFVGLVGLILISMAVGMLPLLVDKKMDYRTMGEVYTERMDRLVGGVRYDLGR